MQNNYLISNFNFILLLMTTIGLKNHVIIIPPLLQVAGRDAWISVLLMFGATLLWGVLLFYIYRSLHGEHIHTWLENSIGKRFTKALIWTLCVFLIIMAGITLKETILWTNTSYLFNTPKLSLTILFIIPCILAALTNIRSIIITNFLFLTFVVIFGFFVAFTNIPFKDYSLLLPHFEHGFSPVLRAMIYQGSGMVELMGLLFLQHELKSRFRYWHYIIIAFILTGLTLGPLLGAIVEFGPTEAALQRYPAYEEWGLARVGKFIEHVDYLSIYQWLSGAFIRITFILFLVRNLLKIESKQGNRWTVVLGATVIVGIVMWPMQNQVFFHLLMNVLLPTTFWFLFGWSIFLGIIAFIHRRKQRVSTHV